MELAFVHCVLLLLCLSVSVRATDGDEDEDLLRQFEVQARDMEEKQDQQKRKFYTENYIYGDLCEMYLANHKGRDKCHPRGSCDDSEGYIRCHCTDRRDGGPHCEIRNVCAQRPCPSREDTCIPTSSPNQKRGRYCLRFRSPYRQHYRELVTADGPDAQPIDFGLTWLDKGRKDDDANDLK